MCNNQDFQFAEKINLTRAEILATMPYDEFYDIFEENGHVYDTIGEKVKSKAYIDSVRRFCKTMIGTKGEAVKNYGYSQKLTTDGRLFVKGFGVQKLENNIRGYLCGDFYNDFDIKNCAPTLLRYLMKTYYPNEKFGYLDLYVNQREKVFEKFKKKGKDKLKHEILVAMNSSARVKTKSEFMVNLDKNFKKAQDLLYTKPNEFTEPLMCFRGINKKNPKGSFLNICLCVLEKTILLKAVGLFEKKYISTLMFDGFHMDKAVDPDDALEKLNEATSEYGVEWVVKEPSNKLDYLDSKEFEEDDLEEHLTYDNVKAEFEKTHFIIECPLNFGREFTYRGKPTYSLYNKSDFIDLTTTYEFDDLVVAKNGEVYSKRVKFFPKWLEDKTKRSYKMIDFIPRHLEDDFETYNTFQGFECAKPYEYTEKPEAVELFKKQVDILTDFSQEGSEYLLQLIAHLFQKPDENPEVGILFKSKQGWGKDTLIEIISAMMGNEYISRTAKIEEYLGQFNGSIKNKLLLQLNELEGKDGWDYRDKLKDLITAKTVIINEKNVKPYTQQFYSRSFIMSNRTNPIEIATDDRRFVVFKANYRQPSPEHFDGLYEIIKDKDSLYTLYHYFMNYKITITRWQKERPKTSAYKNMKEGNVNPLYEFLNEIIVDGRIDEYFEKEDDTYFKNKKNGCIYICCDEMLRAYKQYLIYNDICYKANAKDLKKFLNDIDIERDRPSIRGKKRYVFKIDKDHLTAQLESMNIGKNDDDEFSDDDWE